MNMALGIKFSVFSLCVATVMSFLFADQGTTQQSLLTTTNLGHVEQFSKLSDADLENMKKIMTLATRVIYSADVALREYENSVLYSAAEHLGNKLETKEVIFSNLEDILSTSLELTCIESRVLQTISKGLKIRGVVNGQENVASEIVGRFQVVQFQLKTLQNFVDFSIKNRRTSQCEHSTMQESFQQYLNFDIVKETRQIVQNLKDFVSGVNRTFNDCETVDLLMTLLSRAKNLITDSNHFTAPSHETTVTFNQTIRYKWNDTIQILCGVLSHVKTVQRATASTGIQTGQTGALDDVIINIQKCLSALTGSSGVCSEKNTPLTDGQDGLRMANEKIDNILFELFSYKKSQFCRS